MQRLHEPGNHLGITRVLAVVFAYLAGVVVERPRFGDFGRNELDDDVHRFYAVEVVGKVGAYPERGLAVVPGILLYLDGLLGIQGVAEDDLLALGVDAQRAVFLHNLHQLLVVVAAVDAQSFEEVGKVFREVHAEYVPPEAVVEEGTQRTAEGVAPVVHGHVVGHLRAEHAPYGTDKFVSHGAHRQQVVLHGQVYVAGADKPAGPLLAVVARFQGTHHGIFALERGPAAGTEVAEYTPGLQEPFALFAGLRVVRVVVEVLALAGHGVVEFRDDSQQFYLQQTFLLQP